MTDLVVHCADASILDPGNFAVGRVHTNISLNDSASCWPCVRFTRIAGGLAAQSPLAEDPPHGGGHVSRLFQEIDALLDQKGFAPIRVRTSQIVSQSSSG